MVSKNNGTYTIDIKEGLLLEILSAIGTQEYEGIDISEEMKELKSEIEFIEQELDKKKYGWK